MIGLQVVIPFLVAGFGMVGAGMVLDIVQHWKVFRDVSEIFILVPSLLGLKGNLEMTLASRMSTQANLGNIELRSELWKMASGNMAILQCQATVVGFLASIAAIVMGWIPDGKFELHDALLLCAGSLTTAAIASAILGAIMIFIVVLSRRCNINPDNVATPIAASLGDLITLSLLASICTGIYSVQVTQVWLAPFIIALFLLLLPLWIYISHRNIYTKDVLYNGWVPVISAMVISSVGGLILDATVVVFDGLAVYQPVINGVGGNLVAVQASKLSTALHKVSQPGVVPVGVFSGCPTPLSTFCVNDLSSRTARVLLLLVVPGQLLFVFVINYMKAGHTSLTPAFVILYLTAALLQVLILLYVANWMVHYMWRKKLDPDHAAIPYLTAIGDLVGTALLAATFFLLATFGKE
ncbi:PREDICTED: solute carrier family 41 member 1-like isoform X2 [Priapulus caudatus]|nr:PREDICTED: solute carrier family 41 member 1-like isoform X2 [Priapulus caudatus]